MFAVFVILNKNRVYLIYMSLSPTWNHSKTNTSRPVLSAAKKGKYFYIFSRILNEDEMVDMIV